MRSEINTRIHQKAGGELGLRSVAVGTDYDFCFLIGYRLRSFGFEPDLRCNDHQGRVWMASALQAFFVVCDGLSVQSCVRPVYVTFASGLPYRHCFATPAGQWMSSASKVPIGSTTF